LALVEGCRHELDITVPVDEVHNETERVIADIQKKARLPGFRPGKAPMSIIRTRFAQEIRQDVMERLVPKYFRKKVEDEHLQVVGSPSVKDVHWHEGEEFHFKAEFEVAPTIELGDYRGTVVKYSEPEVTEEDVEKRIEQIREQKAEYVNVDPRPVQEGDHVLVTLKSLAGVEPPMEQGDVSLHIDAEDTLPAFVENIRGMSPGDQKEFEVTYPEDYGQAKLAGKTVQFLCTLDAVRRKELPEMNDEFAKDLGDYQNLEELRNAIRQAIKRDRDFEAQQSAKNEVVDKLVDAHDFPVPEAFVERQIETIVENRLRTLASQGIDPGKLQLDWAQVKAKQHDRAVREVKAALILERIAEREAIYASKDEVDHEVQRIAKQRREPVAAVRASLEKDGTIARIANHIRTEKVLNFLFEHARKEVDPEASQGFTGEEQA
jgi:trigger factor